MQRATRRYIVTPENMVLQRIDMPKCDILCRAPNRNILSRHALPHNIANVIFVNLLLQKCDGTCFAVTATHKFTSRPLASRQGMSTSQKWVDRLALLLCMLDSTNSVWSWHDWVFGRHEARALATNPPSSNLISLMRIPRIRFHVLSGGRLHYSYPGCML